jgi:hypothetical protein
MGAVHSKPLTDLERAEMDARIMELKRQDLSFQQIADQLGISRAAAHRGFHRALPRITEPAATAYRAEHLARLELVREVVMGILETRHVTISNGHVVSEITGVDDDGKPIYGEPYEDDAAVLAAANTLLKIDDQEATLLGLKAKAEIAVSGGIRYEIVGLAGEELT